MKLSILVKRVRNDANGSSPLPLPKYQTPFASGVDLMADIEETIILKPGERKLVPTGLSIELPPCYEAQIRPRSGLAIKHGISMVNAPGTIDSDYRGEIGIILINHGSQHFTIQRGDRIAQMVISPVMQATFIESENLTETMRAQGGFGSTGH